MSGKITTRLPLSTSQLTAVRNNKNIRLSADQVKKIGTGSEVTLRKRQVNKLDKATKEKKGVIIDGGQIGLLAALLPTVIKHLPTIAAALSGTASAIDIGKSIFGSKKKGGAIKRRGRPRTGTTARKPATKNARRPVAAKKPRGKRGRPRKTAGAGGWIPPVYLN